MRLITNLLLIVAQVRAITLNKEQSTTLAQASDCDSKITLEGVTFCEDDYKTKVGSGTVKGTKKDDFLKGWNTDDKLSGKKGADLIFGMDGDDTIHGDEGNDTLIGGKGDDYIVGGEDNDVILGGQGNDTIELDEGKDKAYGGSGDDVLISMDGGDELSGGSAVDGNTFVIMNTTENGEVLIKDFWSNEKNNIVIRDNQCATEAQFEIDDLSACLPSAESKPNLHVNVEDCTTTFGIKSDSEEYELCKTHDLMCPTQQLDIEQQTKEATDDHHLSIHRFEMLQNDLFLVYSDGFIPFSSLDEELDQNGFETKLNDICSDTVEVPMLEIPDKCSDTTHFNAMVLKEATQRVAEVESLSQCTKELLGSVCQEKQTDINERAQELSALTSTLNLEIEEYVAIICGTDLECNKTTLESELRSTYESPDVTLEIRIPQETDTCDFLVEEYGSIDQITQELENFSQFIQWLEEQIDESDDQIN